MTTKISQRDWEALSAFLDDQLSSGESARLKERLQIDQELRTALEEIQRTRIVLRSQTRLRAPRNFTLTQQMAGVRPATGASNRAYPIFRLVSAFASILLVLILAGDLIGGFSVGRDSQPVSAPREANQSDHVVTDAQAIPASEAKPEITLEAIPQALPDIALESETEKDFQETVPENQTFALQGEGAPEPMAKAAPPEMGSAAAPLMQAPAGNEEPPALPSAASTSTTALPLSVPETLSENTFIPLRPLTSTADVSMAAIQTPSEDESSMVNALTSTSAISSLPQVGTKAAFAIIASDTPLPPTPYQPTVTPAALEAPKEAYPPASQAIPLAEREAGLQPMNWAEIALAVVALSTGLAAILIRFRERK